MVLHSTWSSLKKCDVKLELLCDPDMLLMIEKGIRGKVSTIPTRYAKENSKYMNPKCNPDEESKFMQYLDANYLYGCQCQNRCLFVILSGCLKKNLKIVDNFRTKKENVVFMRLTLNTKRTSHTSQ